MAAIAPGDILRNRFLRPLNLTAADLAKAMCISQSVISRIINGKSSITADIALRLEKALNVSAQTWMNIQTAHDLEVAKKKMEASPVEVVMLYSGATQDVGKPMGKESRDRKVARALLRYIAKRAAESPGKPIKIHFSRSEDNAATLTEICRQGGWISDKVIHQAKVLQAISKILFEAGVLRAWTPPIGTKTISYSLSSEWLKRLAPSKSSDLGEFVIPDGEMEGLLDSIYPRGGCSSERHGEANQVLPGATYIQLRDRLTGCDSALPADHV